MLGVVGDVKKDKPVGLYFCGVEPSPVKKEILRREAYLGRFFDTALGRMT